MNQNDDDETLYQVVVNGEEQYSIWPAARPLPNGWKAVGTQGRKAECLGYIKESWTDMRPLSVRRRMDVRPGEAQRVAPSPRPPSPRT